MINTILIMAKPKIPIPPAPRREPVEFSGPEDFPEDELLPKTELLPERPILRRRSPGRASPPGVLGMPETVSSGPPVFIKIDKYREVVEQLHTLKSCSLSLRDALDALAEVERELQQGLSMSHRALDKFNTIITNIDSKITRVPSKGSGRTDEGEELENYVRGVHDQMEKVKKGLKAADL